MAVFENTTSKQHQLQLFLWLNNLILMRISKKKQKKNNQKKTNELPWASAMPSSSELSESPGGVRLTYTEQTKSPFGDVGFWVLGFGFFGLGLGFLVWVFGWLLGRGVRSFHGLKHLL